MLNWCKQSTCKEQWILYLLRDIHSKHSSPIIIYCDNKSSLHIVANPVFHERMKHIEINFHVFRDEVQAGVLHFLPIASKNQVTDILTKPLHTGPFSTYKVS